MSTIKQLEKLGFEGIDISLEISLFEYRMIWRPTNEPNEYQFLFAVDEDQYDTGFFTKESFEQLTKESWFEIDEVCSFIDSTPDEFLADFPRNVRDAVSYHGEANVFGTTYYPITLKEFKPSKF